MLHMLAQSLCISEMLLASCGISKLQTRTTLSWFQDIGAAELLLHVLQTDTFEHLSVEHYTFLNFGGDTLLNLAIAHQLLYSQLTCTTPTFTPALHKLALIAVDRAAQNFRTHAPLLTRT